ncbi:MAG: hypothetical protein DRQ62_14410 [Gammaproteobacteria bacterium]|nr:MAG: hypothetical protein DRQ62_14410 [Gammaproteobacteria bacterium]
MYWQWITRQGNERSTNNDAVGVVDTANYFFTIIVDAAEKGDQGTTLAKYWAQAITQNVGNITTPTPDAIVELMQEKQQALRNQFLHEIASYTAILYDKNNNEGHAIISGDCRLGLQQAGDITWLTNVQTLANADGSFFGPQHLKKESRHTLTRSLNAKRFTQPEVSTITLPEGAVWLLCTDGYWAEHLCENKRWDQLADDASCLKIAHHKLPEEQSTKTVGNYFNYSKEQN